MTLHWFYLLGSQLTPIFLLIFEAHAKSGSAQTQNMAVAILVSAIQISPNPDGQKTLADSRSAPAANGNCASIGQPRQRSSRIRSAFEQQMSQTAHHHI